MLSVSVAVGLSLAVICALGTNIGWLIKHRGAQQCPPMRHRRPLSSVRMLFRSRWFAIGVLVASLAGLLHIAALVLAPISVVQAVMAGGIVILAVIAQRLFAHRVSRRQWWGVALAAVGLALLGFSLPAIRGAHTHFSGGVMVLFDGLLLGTSALLLGASRVRRLAAYDGVLIGAAAGIFFGISDVGVKALVGVVNGGALALLLSPWLLVVLASGVLAQYVSARSLQSGDAISVAALTGLAINGANIAGGILVFGDPLAHGTLGSLAEVLAFALICAAALLTPRPAVARGARQSTGAQITRPLMAHRVRRATRRALGLLAPQRVAPLCGLLAFAGATLLLTSELVDRFEAEVGASWMSVTFALPIAFFVAYACAAVADELLWAIERRRGRRPGGALITPLLALVGGGFAIEIALHHLHAAPRLDAWLGIAGSLMLMLVVLLRFSSRVGGPAAQVPSG